MPDPTYAQAAAMWREKWKLVEKYGGVRWIGTSGGQYRLLPTPQLCWTVQERHDEHNRYSPGYLIDAVLAVSRLRDWAKERLRERDGRLTVRWRDQVVEVHTPHNMAMYDAPTLDAALVAALEAEFTKDGAA
jgi:hypothetical protein